MELLAWEGWETVACGEDERGESETATGEKVEEEARR